MRLLSVLTAACIFFVGAVCAEDLTTGNLVPGMGDFSTSGSTSVGTGQGCSSGAYCTSGTQGGGGTYISNFNVPLTEGEVKQGFTLNSGITINSHQSNSVLDSCTDIMQSGDCRDIFKLTITLKDDGTSVETFSHQEELNWTGLKDFTYTDTVAANDYGVLTGVFSLFGIDAGYPYGFYGPQFSDPSLTIDYTTVLVQQQIETEIQQAVEQTTQAEIIQVAEVAVPVTTVSTTSSAPPPVAPPGVTTPTTTQDTSSPSAQQTTAPPAPPPAPSAPVIAPVASTTEENSQQETQAEAEIEAEVQTQNETSTSEITETGNEQETTETASESSEEPQSSNASSGTAANTPTRTRPKAVAKTRKTAKTKIRMSPAQAAQVVVSRIAPSQRYGSNAQTVTMVAMGMIAQTGGLLKSKGLPDAVKFFKTAKIPDGPSLVDPLQNYVLFGTSNAAHDALVESQWRK